MMAEFLPLCDVLFNVISLAGYFCDVVFDVVMGYALLERGYKATFAAAISIVLTSLLISQILSLRWYLHVWSNNEETRKDRPPWMPIMLHCLQLGVLWRYAKLLIPVDLRNVKHEVRDLCMLRLVHAFCEAAPMLLLQLHILFEQEATQDGLDLAVPTEPSIDEPAANKSFEELNVISASLSLFSVCWALASFSKNVRLQNVHRLVLTWLGVIFQFLWRLGTISARICALTAYALVYKYWVFLVIGLHWVSMFLWLISPKNVFHGERISRPRKAYLSALIAFVYVFAYINLQELNHRQKMVTFYCVMIVENCLLVCAWAWGSTSSAAPLAGACLASFCTGLAFMLIYYRYFHVRRLAYILGENQQGTNSTNTSSQSKNGKLPNQNDNAAIPGVFNCRFSNPVGNSGNCRKKKKPTSFVPPPPAPAAAFWRRPLPISHHHHGGSSENEGSSVGSRVNIQQKLQEKKQKQLAELLVIEEEIKQGKLAKTSPVAVEEIYCSLQRQPIPRAKTHADPPAWSSIELSHAYQNYPILTHTCNIYPTYSEINMNGFQNNSENQSESNPLRSPNKVFNQDSRTFYESPANLRNDVPRTPIRSPNYMDITENRNGNPNRNQPIAASNSYERKNSSLEKNRMHYETRMPDYCDNNNQNAYKYAPEMQGMAIQNGDTHCYSEGGLGLFPYPVKCKQEMRKQRCHTPEILLAPHYLDNCNRQVCCHWRTQYDARKKEEEGSSGSEVREPTNGQRPHSDIDSQISLPRSYTLPREFRYWRRRPRPRDLHAPSNNSSDGDVDSEEDNERQSNCSATSQIQSPTYIDTYYGNRQEFSQNVDTRPAYSVDGPLYNGFQNKPRRVQILRKQNIAKPETKL